MAVGSIGAHGLSAYSDYGISLANVTGQTLYRGNIVEIDWLNINSLSIPTAAQLTAGLDGANLGAQNGALPSAIGLQANMGYGVVETDGPIAPNSFFTAKALGMWPVQVNPFQSQVITFGPAATPPTGGSVILSMTSNGTLSTTNGSASLTNAATTTAANLNAALGTASGYGTLSNTVVQNAASTLQFTVTFANSVLAPGQITLVNNGLTGGAGATVAITQNTNFIVPGTLLTPVAGETYAAPVAYPGNQQLIQQIGDVGTLVLVASYSVAGTSLNSVTNVASTSTFTLTGTLATEATNIQGSLQAMNYGANITVVSYQDQGLLVTFPQGLLNPSFTVTSSTAQTSGANIAISNLLNPNQGGGEASGCFYALENGVVANAPPSGNGNGGYAANIAPTYAPSNPTATSTTNPVSYFAPQYTIRCWVDSLPHRRSRSLQ